MPVMDGLRLSVRRFALAMAGAVALLATGCTQGTYSGRGPMRDDIVAIRQYTQAYPWIIEDGRVRGLQARIYFLSAETGKGVFVPGAIWAGLHTVERQTGGGLERELVYEWTFNRSQATDFRIPEPSILGYSYGLIFLWPPELDLRGEEIQLAYRYVRGDGREVRRAGSTFAVPGAGRPAFQHDVRESQTPIGDPPRRDNPPNNRQE